MLLLRELSVEVDDGVGDDGEVREEEEEEGESGREGEAVFAGVLVTGEITRLITSLIPLTKTHSIRHSKRNETKRYDVLVRTSFLHMFSLTSGESA